jgi:hypothetical protein
MSRLIRALSLLCAVLRKGSRVRVYSRKILRFSLIALTILIGQRLRLRDLRDALCCFMLKMLEATSMGVGPLRGSG